MNTFTVLGLIDQAINNHIYILQILFFCHIFDAIVNEMLMWRRMRAFKKKKNFSVFNT